MISPVSSCAGPLVLKGYTWNDGAMPFPPQTRSDRPSVLFGGVNHAIINIFFHDSHLKEWWLLLTLLPCESVVPWEAVWPTSPISSFPLLQNHILSLLKCSRALCTVPWLHPYVDSNSLSGVWNAAWSCGEYGWTKCSTVSRDLIPEKRDALLSKAWKEVANEASISEKISQCWT